MSSRQQLTCNSLETEQTATVTPRLPNFTRHNFLPIKQACSVKQMPAVPHRTAQFNNHITLEVFKCIDLKRTKECMQARKFASWHNVKPVNEL